MTTQEIYNAGLAIVRKAATMEYNAMNDDPNLNMEELYAIKERVIKFIGWADNNGKGQDLRHFLTAMQSKQTSFEYTSLIESLEWRGIKL